MKYFTESRFGYYPLIWMFHGREVNKTNYLQQRSLRIVYKDNNSSFKDLRKQDNSFTVHHKNIQSLAIEFFKVKENLSNRIMNSILQTRTLTYNLRSQPDSVRSFVNTSRYYFGSKVCNILPSDIKNASNLHIFKNKIKKWERKEWHCAFCGPYLCK